MPAIFSTSLLSYDRAFEVNTADIWRISLNFAPAAELPLAAAALKGGAPRFVIACPSSCRQGATGTRHNFGVTRQNFLF